MLNEKAINQEIVELNSLQVLTQAYEEIASIRMKKSREVVLTRRDFINDINNIFNEVRASYARQVLQYAKKRWGKSGEKVTFLSHNGKTVSVFLSANTGLYGEIIKNTFNQFIKEVRTNIPEVTIIGKYGLSLFLQEEPDRPYTYYDLPDHNVSSFELMEIVKHIVQYEEIHVYFGKFINVINQKPTKLAISAEMTANPHVAEEENYYLFEPTLEQILMFFESQIFASLFEQVISESELAKFASRVVAMDKASENIKSYLDRLKSERLKVTHRVSNRKQLNSVASLYLR